MNIDVERWRETWERFGAWVERRAVRILVVAIIVSAVALSAAGAWKLWANEYDAIDLAIYTQTLEHTVRGDLFGLTIHPHSYLGDHAEFSLLALVPLYAIARSALTPLVVQAFGLSLAALPLFWIARRRLGTRVGLLLALLFLANPFLQNAGLFEYHHLIFIIPLLLFLFNAYDRRTFGAFVIILLLALTVREDVGLFTLPFALLALIERRRWQWIVAPGALSLLGLAASFSVIASFNPDGGYKFLAFYGWLGGSVGEMIRNAARDPLLVLGHLFRPENLLFLFGMFLPFLFLPFRAPKYLIFLVIPFLQIGLGIGGSQLVLQTHYISPFLPFLAVGTVFGLAALRDRLGVRPSRFLPPLPFLLVLLTVTTIYANLTFGPLVPVIREAFNPRRPEQSDLRRDVVRQIPAEASVAASYEFLTPLAIREKLYSLNYAFTGRRQFSDAAYELPDDVEYLIFDTDDLLAFQSQYSGNAERYDEGDDRLRAVIDRGFRVTAWIDRFFIFTRTTNGEAFPIQRVVQLPDTARRIDAEFTDGITLIGLEGQSREATFPVVAHQLDGRPYSITPFTLYWQADRLIEQDDHLLLTVRDEVGKAVDVRRFPLGYGILPPREWQAGDIVSMPVRLLVPDSLAAGTYTLELALIREQLRLGLNGIRSSELKPVTSERLGPDVVLGSLTVTE